MDPKKALEIKNIISGLLISTPLRSSISQLCKDYKEIEGRSIPFKELGFSSLEDYLRSIPDTVTVYGSGPRAEVEAVISSKSEHINAMVLKQKKGKVKPFKIMHKPRYSQSMKTNFGTPKPPNIKYPQYSYPPPAPAIFIPPDLNSIPSLFNVNNQYTPNINSKEFIKEVKTEPKLVETPVLQSCLKSSKTETKSKLFSLEEEAEICASLKTEEKPFEDNNPGHKVPFKVRKNLQTLIDRSSYGLQCSKLLSEYKCMFKKTLHYEEYSYRSVIEMCVDLPEIFQYTQETSDDYMLYSLNVPVSKKEAPVLSKSVQVENVAKNHILEECPKKSAISVMMPDVVTIDDQIIRLFPADVKVGDILELNIGEIYDISKFWVYPTFGELDTLMAKLQTFFAAHSTRYLIPEVVLEAGLYCVTLFKGDYHRCVIVNMMERTPNYIRVFYIDYGTVDNVKRDEVWYLPKEFSETPCQAIRARLANIYPVYQDRPWCAEAVAKFERLITMRDLVAKITKVDEKDHVLEIYLADITDKDHIFYINDVFVKEGYALYTDQIQKKNLFVDHDCKVNVRFIHLYPEFYEIEAGMAPTPEEKKFIAANKIPMHHYLPHYFDIHYYEDINGIQLQHEKCYPGKVTDVPIPPVEQSEFDFDFFHECLRGDIIELYKQEHPDAKIEKTFVSEESAKAYFCNKKRLLEIKDGKVSSGSESPSPHTSLNNLFNQPEAASLNNSLQQLNLSGDSFINNLSGRNSTNPFVNNSNPFRSTNPFLQDLEENFEKTESFKIFNNLKEPCTCKMNKKVNVEKETIKKSENPPIPVVTPPQEPRRVRTPPGFHSLTARPTGQNLYYANNYNTGYMYPPGNNFYNQNQLFMTLPNFSNSGINFLAQLYANNNYGMPSWTPQPRYPLQRFNPPSNPR